MQDIKNKRKVKVLGAHDFLFQIQLRQLMYFLAVAENLSFSRAAEMLDVAQPAISQQIRALEQVLDTRLFNRIGKKISLTDAGRALLPHARQILAAVQAAENDVRERGGLLRGRTSLGAPPTVSTYVLPERLVRFRQEFPSLDVMLREAGTETLLAQLEQGKLDLAIVSDEFLPARVEHMHFLDEEYVLAVSTHHPFLSRRHQVAMTELATEPFILFPEGYKLREVTLEACHQAGFEPRVALDGGAIMSALEFVGAGLGVAIVPELALTESHHLHALRITDQNLRRALGLVWLKNNPLSPAARALRDFLVRNKSFSA